MQMLKDVKLLFVQNHVSRWDSNLCFTEEETEFFLVWIQAVKGFLDQFQLVEASPPQAEILRDLQDV